METITLTQSTEWLDFHDFVAGLSGIGYFPTDQNDICRFMDLYDHAAPLVDALTDHPVKVSFSWWMKKNHLDQQIPPLEPADDPNSPDATKQLQFLHQCYARYQDELKNRAFFCALDCGDAFMELLADPQTAEKMKARESV